MKTLAIDPGTAQSGYVIIDSDSRILQCGVEDNPVLLELLKSNTDKTLRLAIENVVSYGQVVGKTTFETCIWIGRFYQTWVDHQAHNDVWLVDRPKIKQHICEGKRGNDSAVVKALTLRFGEKGTAKQPGWTYGLKSHAWQAFALGVYCNDKLNAVNL